ncbi:MAG TPA: hypothetical protein VF318_02740 [Dehalococcoidales bacterium]
MSKRKKKLGKTIKDPQAVQKTSPAATRPLTIEEKAEIIKNRIANRPVIVLRYRNGKWNMRFIVALAVLVIALIASVYFLSRW